MKRLVLGHGADARVGDDDVQVPELGDAAGHGVP
jgi:hypothetical protein